MHVASLTVLPLRSSLLKCCCTFALIMFRDNGFDLPCRRTWGQGDWDIPEDSLREVF